MINDSNNSVTAGARGEGALRGAQRPAAHFTHRPRTDSRPAPRRPRRVALALAVLAVLATVAPEQAVAQSEITLVGNAGQPTGERHTASFQGVVDHAQQFTTGPNAAGDTLTKVEFLSNDAQGHTFSAQLCEANNTGEAAVPDPMNCQTLSTTSSFAQGSVVVFTPPAGMTITLAASTRYVVVLSENNSPSAVVDILSTQANNQNGEAGWTLADVFDWKQNGTTWMKQGSGRDALIMDVKGYATYGPPAAVSDVVAVPVPRSASSLTVSWTAPENTGKPAPIAYDVRYRETDTFNWTTVRQDAAANTSLIITGLRPNGYYDVQVLALNADGSGPWSSTAEGTTSPLPETVLANHPLIPDDLGVGDAFRLLYVTTAMTAATDKGIHDYHDFAAGQVVGLIEPGNLVSDWGAIMFAQTALVSIPGHDARLLTDTTWTGTDRGVPIYWLNGARVADDYADFYDGAWADEDNPRNGLGQPYSLADPAPWTGTDHDGTELFDGAASRAMGQATVGVGAPGSTANNAGRLNGAAAFTSTEERPLYGLWQVMVVDENLRLVDNKNVRANGDEESDTRAAARVSLFTTGPHSTCWPEITNRSTNPQLSRVPGASETTTVKVVVACNQTLPRTPGSPTGPPYEIAYAVGRYNTIQLAAKPDRTSAWITPPSDGDGYPTAGARLRTSGLSTSRADVYVTLTLGQNPSRTQAREGTLDWDDTSLPNASPVHLDTLTVVQQRRALDNNALTLSCKTSGCDGGVTALARVDLKLTVSGLASDDVECAIEESRPDCTWRIRKEPVNGDGYSHNLGGRLLAGGTSDRFTWEAPAIPAGSSSIAYHAYVQIETNLVAPFDRSGNSNSINFTVNADDATVPPRMIDVTLGCEQNRPKNSGYGTCLWDTNNPPSDGKIIVLGHISTDPPCSGSDRCWGTPEWRYNQVGAERRILTPGASETLAGGLKAHAKLEWKIGTLGVGEHDQVGLGTDSAIDTGGTGTVVNIQVRDTNEPPEIGRQDDRGGRIDGITCQLNNPDGQDQVDPNSCTVLRGYTGGAANILRLRLGVKDPDSQIPNVEWSGRGVFTPEGSSAQSAYASWDSTGLSAGQYTLTATITENRGAGKPTSNFRATRTVRVTVEDYDAPPEVLEPTEPDRTQTCDPNYQGTLFVDDLYCGHRHSSSHTWTGFTPHSDYVWSRAVGSAGQPSVVLENSIARSGMRLRARENRICGIARGVCGEYVDNQVHSESGNVYQWVNYTPEP